MNDFTDLKKLEMTFWVVTIIVMVMFAIYFIRRALSDEDVPKRFNISAGILFLGMGLHRNFSNLFEFYTLFYRNPMMLFLGNICLFLGIVPLLLYMEKAVFKKTKYLLTIAAVILFGVFVFIAVYTGFNNSIMYPWVIPPFAIGLFVIFGGYIYLIIKSTGDVRKNSILILVGCFIMISFWFLHGVFGEHGQMPLPVEWFYIAYIYPLVMIVGAIIAAKGFFGTS